MKLLTLIQVFQLYFDIGLESSSIELFAPFSYDLQQRLIYLLVLSSKVQVLFEAWGIQYGLVFRINGNLANLNFYYSSSDIFQAVGSHN